MTAACPRTIDGMAPLTRTQIMDRMREVDNSLASLGNEYGDVAASKVRAGIDREEAFAAAYNAAEGNSIDRRYKMREHHGVAVGPRHRPERFGRAVTFTLGYLIELASTLGLEPHELIVTGGVIAADAYIPPVRPWSSTLQPVIARDPCTGSTGVPDGARAGERTGPNDVVARATD